MQIVAVDFHLFWDADSGDFLSDELPRCTDGLSIDLAALLKDAHSPKFVLFCGVDVVEMVVSEPFVYGYSWSCFLILG